MTHTLNLPGGAGEPGGFGARAAPCSCSGLQT
jgi:hypothetical protein